MTAGERRSVDEPSRGLAPKIVEEVFRLVTDLQRTGQTVLLVEQMASLGYVFERGRVAGHGPSQELLRGGTAGRLSEIYLGRDGAGPSPSAAGPASRETS